MLAVKNEVKQKITMVIEDEAYVSMMRYAHMFSPNECGGTGLVARVDYTDGSTEFVVKKVYLPNQINTSVTTDIEDEEMARVNTQIVVDGDDTALHKFHWHSHVDMGVFHSSTDEENYDEMRTGDYAISLVVNKKYDMLGSVHLYNPLRIDIKDIEIKPPDVNIADYEVPAELAVVLQENVDKVHAYQREQEAKKVTYARGSYGLRRYDDDYAYVYNHKTGVYDPIDDDDAYFMGGCNEMVLLSLLLEAEKEALITLDMNNAGVVLGYIVLETGKYFTIDVEPDTLQDWT